MEPVPISSERRIDAFEAVALPIMDDLYRAASAILRNRTEADDAVQEAYLQAWKCFDRFQPGTNFRAWMCRILFHVISHQRRKWYSRFVPSEREDMERMPAADPAMAEHLTDPEMIAAFRKIPQSYAEVVMLVDVQEFSYKEVQETLGIPIGTVMSRLSRGRRLLRQELADCAAQVRIGGSFTRAPA